MRNKMTFSAIASLSLVNTCMVSGAATRVVAMFHMNRWLFALGLWVTSCLVLIAALVLTEGIKAIVSKRISLFPKNDLFVKRTKSIPSLHKQVME